MTVLIYLAAAFSVLCLLFLLGEWARAEREEEERYRKLDRHCERARRYADN